MKILLINPAQPINYMAKTANTFLVPQNTLASVAALTPDEEVEIADELIEPINFDTDADIVGITAMTDNVVRAYELADAFRSRGLPVVMGGAHTTAVPHESLRHADAVVVGEAEGSWEKLIDNFKKGKRPKGIYKNPGLIDLADLKWPRRDLIKKRKEYLSVDMVQTTRGCPYKCEFCSVSTFFGLKFRKRPVHSVIQELEEDCGRNIFFVDDSLSADRKYARDLFKEMIPLNKKWISQVTMNTADDRELVRLMKKSGCSGIFVGVESIDQTTLQGMHKPQNRVSKYSDQIKSFQDHGIPVLGGFVFGFDQDDEGVFDRTLEFIFRTGIEMASFTILTPLPGTPLYDRWVKEGKFRFENDWWLHRNWTEVLFNPQKMTADRLREGWARTAIDYYRKDRIALRVIKNVKNGFENSFFVLQMNLSYREAAWNLAKHVNII